MDSPEHARHLVNEVIMVASRARQRLNALHPATVREMVGTLVLVELLEAVLETARRALEDQS